MLCHHHRYPVPDLVPGTHVFIAIARSRFKAWMTGTSPVTGRVLMTVPCKLRGRQARSTERDSPRLGPGTHVSKTPEPKTWVAGINPATGMWRLISHPAGF